MQTEQAGFAFGRVGIGRLSGADGDRGRQDAMQRAFDLGAFSGGVHGA